MEAGLDGGGARRHRHGSGIRMVPAAMTKSGGGDDEAQRQMATKPGDGQMSPDSRGWQRCRVKAEQVGRQRRVPTAAPDAPKSTAAMR
jgi:hypothetical protein